MKFLVLMTFGVFLSLGCSMSKKNVLGIYKENTRSAATGSSIELKSDGTFLFKSYFGDLFKINVGGTWKAAANNKSISLLSDINNEGGFISVIERVNDSLKGKIKITAYYQDSSKVYGDIGFIAYDGDTLVKKPWESGNIYINTISVKKFSIKIFGTGSRNFYHKVKNQQANEFEIYLRVKNADEYRIFNNEKWKLRRNKLMDSTSLYYKVF